MTEVKALVTMCLQQSQARANKKYFPVFSFRIYPLERIDFFSPNQLKPEGSANILTSDWRRKRSGSELAALSKAIHSTNVEQAFESDMIIPKSRGIGIGRREKGAGINICGNRLQEGRSFWDKDIKSLNSGLRPPRFCLSGCLVKCTGTGKLRKELLFRITGLKAVRKPRTSETLACQSNRPRQGSMLRAANSVRSLLQARMWNILLGKIGKGAHFKRDALKREKSHDIWCAVVCNTK